MAFYPSLIPDCCEDSSTLCAPQISCNQSFCRDPRIPDQAEMFSCFCPPPCTQCDSCCKNPNSKVTSQPCHPCGSSIQRRETYCPIYTCKVQKTPIIFETVYTKSFTTPSSQL